MVASIVSLPSSASTCRYFEKDGYYAKDDPEHKEASHWRGLGAEELGLKGHVEPDDFKNVLDGDLPGEDEKLGRIKNGEHEHTAGLDMVFIAPKSVSIEALVLGQEAVEDAHYRAVDSTLEHMQDKFIATRRTSKGNRVYTGNMVCAVFNHDTSRNLDPHLHSHCVLGNATQLEGGKWAAVDLSIIKRNSHYFGAYYRNELAHNLHKAGYQLEKRMIGRVEGFELAGYSKETLDHFSSRRQDMLKYMADHNMRYTSHNAQIAALATRPAKEYTSREELKIGWGEYANEKGLEKSPQAEHVPKNPNILQTINDAIQDIERGRSVFSAIQLETKVLGELAGEVTKEQITEKINQLEADGHLVSAKMRGTPVAYVTRETLNAERHMVSYMREGKDSVNAINPGFDMDKLDSSFPFSPSQSDAIEMVLSSTDKVMGVQGYAGTGKTTMLKTVAENANDYQVLGLAPTVAARKVLSDEANIPSQTLQGFLKRFDGIDQMPHEDLEKHQENYSNTLLVVDEASMVSTRQMRSLFDITDKLDIDHVVLVGDSKQLRSIEAGQPFRQLQEHGMSRAVMQDIMRQKDQGLRSAVEATIEGDIKFALDQLGNDLVKSEDLGRDAAHQWLSLDHETRENTLLLAPTHDLRKDINETIRDGLKIEGTLTGKAIEHERLINQYMSPKQKSEPQYYNEGDVLVFHRDAKNYRIKKGDHYTVTGVTQKEDKEGNMQSVVNIMNDEGQTRTLKVASVTSKIEYNYEVYEPRGMELMAGDIIRHTRNDHDLGIANGDESLIAKITSSKIHVLQEGAEKPMVLPRDHPVLKHIDHGYSSTVHGAQGKTADHVIAVMDSEYPQMNNQQSFYVEISRAAESVMVFTDDIENLTEILEASTGEKLTAMEATGEKGTALEVDQENNLANENMAELSNDNTAELSDEVRIAEPEVKDHTETVPPPSIEGQGLDVGTDEIVGQIYNIEEKPVELSDDTEQHNRVQEAEDRLAVVESLSDERGVNLMRLDIDVIEFKRDDLDHINDLGRIAAEQWLALPEDVRENTSILAPTRGISEVVNETIRTDFVENGIIHDKFDGAPSLFIEQLVPLKLTDAELNITGNYYPGDIVQFEQGVGDIVRPGETLEILGAEDGVVQIQKETGEKFNFDPNPTITDSITIYEKREMELQAGDTIQWTRDDEDHNIVSTQRAQVMEINDDTITLLNDNGNELIMSVDDPALQHSDYSFNFIAHEHHSHTQDDLIAILSSENSLATQQDFYMDVSCVKGDVKIFTDDREQIVATLEHNNAVIEDKFERGIIPEAHFDVPPPPPALDPNEYYVEPNNDGAAYAEGPRIEEVSVEGQLEHGSGGDDSSSQGKDYDKDDDLEAGKGKSIDYDYDMEM
jgi:conjugative relaxase-like TrwC/TraI family protein